MFLQKQNVLFFQDRPCKADEEASSKGHLCGRVIGSLEGASKTNHETEDKVGPRELNINMDGYEDARGVKYKKPYDKSAAQGDDSFGPEIKDKLDILFS